MTSTTLTITYDADGSVSLHGTNLQNITYGALLQGLAFACREFVEGTADPGDEEAALNTYLEFFNNAGYDVETTFRN